MIVAKYKRKPVYSLKSLGLMLGESPESLLKLSVSCNFLYREVLQEKKDKSVRVTYDAFEPLKKIQRKLVDRLFVFVDYPIYLHGGIKDNKSPRSPFSNAREHASAKSIALQDITNFFPSITIDKVRWIFEGFFGFGRGVSEVLALIVTKDGYVPQGASTSSYIANLVFWDVEPRLVDWMHTKGLAYSRFADDITISSKKQLLSAQWSEVVSKVTGMLAQKGFKQKRAKMHILKKGQAITCGEKQEPLVVTGLGISGCSAGVVKAERNRIKAAVREFEVQVESGKVFEEVAHLYHSAMGRVGRMIACKQVAGLEFKRRLNKAKNKSKISVIEKYKRAEGDSETFVV
ncbi:reverse transcriptase family protein [Pseudomonas sp. B21-021]|uniref:reverse transcriptase family protein n=1 Tax=Pseudomonas sp. B21-021 TaxID=2895476 RepID=UPI00215E0A57|nr:reverse transcriptase family protein [Pseudomonas sp. B21-021]UVM25613.1 reverse transcriptase family protein [Pseudomonas sp. B21-021]